MKIEIAVSFETLAKAAVAMTLAFACTSYADDRDHHAEKDAMTRIHFQRGQARSSGAGRSPLMTFHNGSVISSSVTQAIFWGSSWTDATFAGDKVNGIDDFFNGFGGSAFANTGTEYYDKVSMVTSASHYMGHSIDTSTPPSSNPKVSTVIAEACKVALNNPDPKAIYFVFTSTGAGNVNYCAWHSWGSCSNGKPIQVAYMPNIDGIAGCDPGDNVTGHSQGLSALANVTSHELMEAITDPRGNGWYDSSGAENGDKCAWSFLPSSDNGGVSTFTNQSQWKLQMEWSNKAYSAGSGHANRSGQKGCIAQ